MNKSTLASTAVGLVLAMISVALHAHGEARHDSNAAPVVKEQSGWGIAADPEQANRSVEVTMTGDMRFTPSAVRVREDETLRIVVRNAGRMMHELVIGDADSLKEHAELMLRFPGMQHDEPYMAHVPPGEVA
ncbi:cupredoxin domain-containing protein [Rhodocyclaceae bacterium SMB388]